MGLLLCIIAFGGALGLTRRSLGAGLSWVLGTGYSYGILRARYTDGISHFIFDAAVAGLYWAVFLRPSPPSMLPRVKRINPWFKALAIWPLVTVLLSPLLPSQPLVVQLVGLRSALYFLPLLLVAARLTREDLDTLAKCAVVLNVGAFLLALLELQMGIEPFFPLSAVTEIMYSSNDVGEERLHRIPSSFISAHAFGGTMLVSLPLLVHCAQRRLWPKLIIAAAIGMTLLNIFISSTRSPVVQLGAAALVVLFTTRPQLKVWAAAVVAAIAVGYVVATNSRFQRFTTLTDTEYVETRVGGSLNASVWELMLDNPLGRGPASAGGTSIPFFLQGDALPQVGLENEFGRIALEQGIIGLGLWVAFIAWTLSRFPTRPDLSTVFGLRTVWSCLLVLWLTAGIGTGLLLSIPSLLLLLLYMGLLGAAPVTEGALRVKSMPRPASALRSLKVPR